MVRFWIGTVLLLGFLLLGFGVSAWAEAAQQPITRQLEEAAGYAAEGAMDKAAALARQAKDLWHRHREQLACVPDHAPMDEIDSLFAQLEIWAHREAPGQLAACCARIGQLIQALIEGQQLTWWNLL